MKLVLQPYTNRLWNADGQQPTTTIVRPRPSKDRLQYQITSAHFERAICFMICAICYAVQHEHASASQFHQNTAILSQILGLYAGPPVYSSLGSSAIPSVASYRLGGCCVIFADP